MHKQEEEVVQAGVQYDHAALLIAPTVAHHCLCVCVCAVAKRTATKDVVCIDVTSHTQCMPAPGMGADRG